MRKDLPTLLGGLFCVNRNHDALAPEFFGPGADQIRIGQGRGVDADLISAGTEHGVHVLDSSQTSADRERHKALVRCTFDHVHHRCTVMGAGSNVEKHHFVGSLVIVTQSQFDWVTHVAQFA